MQSIIKAITYAVPNQRLTHSDLCERFGTAVMDKIARLSGILERRVCSKNECASDLAESAARALLEKTSIDVNSIDLLILATQTPDYILPSTSCILQHKLGLKKSCASFDVNLGCSQFIYAIANAKAWIESGLAKRALVLCADTPSKLIHPKDKSALSLFGDAACAVLIEASETKGIVNFDFGTDGEFYDALIVPCSAMRNPPTELDNIEYEDEDGNIRTNKNLKIDGLKIFSFAYKTIPDSINALLKKNSLKISDIDMFFFHQAGEKIISASAKRLKIPPQKVYYKMHDIGNCGGASVGIALADAIMTGKLKAGMKIVCCAFGVGLSWGSALIEWNEGCIADKVGDFSNSPTKPESQLEADL